MVVVLGSKVFSWFLVMLQVWYYMELVLDVLLGLFNLLFKVDLVVVWMIFWLVDKLLYVLVDMCVLGMVVMMVFLQWCKVLCNMLGVLCDVIDFEVFGFDLGCCVEEVLVEDFVVVVNVLLVN